MTLQNKQTITKALIICTKNGLQNTTVAGMSIGERLLLSLYYGGIKSIAFTGNGSRLKSSRVSLNIISIDDLVNSDESILVCTSDLVFDKSLIKNPDKIDDNFPLSIQNSSTIKDVTENNDIFNINRQVTTQYNFALRVCDKESAELAKKILFKSLIKPIDGVISKNINRKFSLFITSKIINSSLTPNQVTVFAMLTGILSGIAAYFGGEYWWALLLAGLLFQTQSMLDGCDGEIARLKYMFSLKGQWMDTVGDDFTNYIFFLGLGLGQAGRHGWQWLTILTFIIFAIQIYASLIMYQRIYKMKTGDLLAIPNMVTGSEPKGFTGKIIRILHTMTKKDFFVFVTSILTAVQLPLISFSLIAAGSLVMAPSLTINEIKIRKAIKKGTLKMP